ncbi:peptidylprolyl isomerase [Litorimonas haliclonae]|uniref:peptidylprolyl isomerase n=1 Tax=Litorimonas haliclonae TaxID=2081977 RepID=UPI0039EE70B3
MMKHVTTALAFSLAMPLAMLGTACSAQETPSEATNSAAEGSNVPSDAWRKVDPENLLLIDTAYGLIGVELYPEIAPAHVERVKALARAGFYDNVPFHRVIEGFMNQTGDGSNGDGSGDSELPDLKGNFTFRRDASMPVTLISARQDGGKSIDVGFYKSLPVASQPMAQSMLTADGKVTAYGLHCRGVTSMARTSDPDTANSQFFLMRDRASHLDQEYTIWGNTVLGHKHLRRFKVGTAGEAGFVPDQMNTVRVAADLADEVRPEAYVMKTNHPAFQAFLKTEAKSDGTYPDICDISVPTKTE